MKRITWVDNFKFFCIIAVMAEHAAMMTGLTDAINTTFYVSGFFFASGYLYRHRDGFWKFFKRKVFQLLIPWFIFSMFIILSAKLFSFESHEESLWQTMLNNLLQIRYQGDEMWFVAALFMCFMPMYPLIKWLENGEKNLKTKLIVTFAVLLCLSVTSYIISDTELIGGKWHQYPWHLEYLFRGLFLMFLGYVFRHFLEEKFDEINRPVFLTAIIVIWLAITLGTQLTHHVFVPLDAIIYRYVSSLFGITVIIGISKKIGQNRYMSFVGRNTITYYGLHGKVESVIHHILFVYVREPYWALCWSFTDSSQLLIGATLCSYLIAIIVSLILIIPAWVLERYCPLVVGKGLKNGK